MRSQNSLMSFYTKIWDYSYIIIPILAWGFWGLVGIVLLTFLVRVSQEMGAFKKISGIYPIATVATLALKFFLSAVFTFSLLPMPWVIAAIYLFIAHIILQTPKPAKEPVEVN